MDEKIGTIKEWKEPMNVKGIQSFLGFANFYRRFIQDYSQITTPLTCLTRKEVSWEWGDKQQMAFDMLKTAMVTEPILQHFGSDWSESRWIPQTMPLEPSAHNLMTTGSCIQ